MRTKLFRIFLCFFLVFLTHTIKSQVRNPFTNTILPLENTGDFVLKQGQFNNYHASFGYIKHHKNAVKALPFVVISKQDTLPWLFLLNGGPGRTNLRLTFEIDSLLTYYQICLPGYRGIDDKAVEKAMTLDEEKRSLFIASHHELFNSFRVSEDIALIINALKLRRVNMAAHSYGSVLTCIFLTNHHDLLDRTYVFSPIDFSTPTIDQKAVCAILKDACESREVRFSDFCKSLDSVYNTIKDKEKLSFGLISHMYTFDGALSVIDIVMENKNAGSVLTKSGELFIKDEWLLDYALKFCRNEFVQMETVSKCQSINQLSYSFNKGIQKYTIEQKPYRCSYPDIGNIRFYVPKYELFTTFIQGHKADTLNFGHADIWEKAPGFILHGIKE